MSEPNSNKPAAIQRIGVREFRGNMTDFLRQARNGSSFLVTSRNEVLAEIHPPSKSVQLRRQPGALRGKIRVAADFDTLPPGVLAAMEDDEG